MAQWRSPFRAAVADAAGDAASSLDDATLLGPARDPRHGALSSGVAFKLAGALKRKPLDVAQAVAAACERRKAEFPGLVRADVASPGYVNLVAAPSVYGDLVAEVLRAGHSYGRSAAGAGRRVNLEFCSANPTGPLTVAHGRQAAVGDCLGGVLDFAGWRVTREYYWNDTGGQVLNLVRSVRARAEQIAAGGDVSAPLPEGWYLGAYVTEVARDLLQEKGRAVALADVPEDPRAPSPLRDAVLERMKEGILADLAALGVRYDAQTSQDDLERSGRVDALLAEFRGRGLVTLGRGALWFKASQFGDTQDWVLVKGDGAYTYRAPDYAYHRDKFERGFDRVVDLWGPDHHAYVGSMRAGLKAMNGDWPGRFDVLLVQFCRMCRGKEEVKMSKRGGTFVTLREVVDEVGPDATRFFFVLRKVDSHLTFDLELAKAQKSENPVFYVQYAHARISGVFRMARERFGEVPPLEGAPDPGPEEAPLLQAAARFPEVVERAAEELEPYVITAYLQELAAVLQSYYQAGQKNHELRVVHPDPDRRRMRLAAIRAVQVVLRNGLTILGVSAPERMDEPLEL